MLKQELIEQLNKLPDDYEIYTRYGDRNQVSDIEFEFVANDEGIGEFYLICSNGKNIQTGTFDGD